MIQTHQILNLEVGQSIELKFTYENVHHHIIPIVESHAFGEFLVGSNDNGMVLIKRIK